MRRVVHDDRPNKQKRMEESGYGFENEVWKEDRHYEFSLSEIEDIETATENLHDHLHHAIDSVISNDTDMNRMGIPRSFQNLIRASWARKDPSVCLRFDLARNERGEIKLIEINGDTPTTLIETALVQWDWLVDTHPDLASADVPGQFNSLHEKLLAAWKKVGERMTGDDWMAFASHSESLEEFATCEYHRDLAEQAGIRTGALDLNPLRSQFMYSPDENVFHEPGGNIINFLYKLYPWEWMWNEEFAPQMAELGQYMGIIEPAWKIVASNKAILSKMYQLAPDHPNLVPAFDTPDTRLNGRFFQKPIWGRESTGIRFVDGDKVITSDMATPDPVSSKIAPVYQAAIDVAKCDGWYTQFGSWIANYEAAGMIMRESETPIISGNSPIVPHLFR